MAFFDSLKLLNNPLKDVYDVIFKDSLHTYIKDHHKNSHLPFVKGKGAIFAVRSKEHFADDHVKGYVITTKETLIQHTPHISHYTPNVYLRYGYTDKEKSMIKGFEEKNLLQINTFVVDIDTKKYSVQDILLECIDKSIGSPSLIVGTDKGYHVYFILSEPLRISNKNNYRSLKYAKRIAQNLKESLKDVGADLHCNHFGFFRVPKNIEWKQLDQTYTIGELIEWSKRQDNDRTAFAIFNKAAGGISTTESEWFQRIINTNHIKGCKGQIGRNNTLFTLALVCYSEGWEYERAFDFLDEYNSKLDNPLSANEFASILDSAYSGRYKGASKEYIRMLLELYVKGGESIPIHLNTRGWYKLKKERKDRVRSHYEEWEQDIIEYISAQKQISEPFFWCTQKQMCEAIGIPQSSLNELLKRSTRLIKTVVGKGRNAKTGWTSVSLFIETLVYTAKKIADIKSSYRIGLKDVVAKWIEIIEPVAGYESLLHYLEVLGVITPITTNQLYLKKPV